MTEIVAGQSYRYHPTGEIWTAVNPLTVRARFGVYYYSFYSQPPGRPLTARYFTEQEVRACMLPVVESYLPKPVGCMPGRYRAADGQEWHFTRATGWHRRMIIDAAMIGDEINGETMCSIKELVYPSPVPVDTQNRPVAVIWVGENTQLR